MYPTEVPVLIVGAGPAGLAAALTLARQGVASLLVERRPTMSELPRSTTLSTRSMELLRSWDLEQEILAGGIDVEWLLWECETLVSASSGTGFATGVPTREQSEVISPVAPACVPQDHLGPVMLDALRSFPAASVRLATEVAEVTPGPGGVRAVLRDSATGTTHEVRSRYLVAGDGAYSTVRRSLGIAMRGPDELAHVVTALFRAPLWELLPEHRYGLYSVTHPEANCVVLPAGPGDRWMFGMQYDPGREAPIDYPPERLRELIRTAAGDPGIAASIERTGSFTFAAQLADRFREGDVFLLGDAAHRVTPRGGTGLNTALQDGHDLGWKLAWVLRGWAPADLLDSYETERRPVAEHNVARSLDEYGSRRSVAEVLHADLGGRIPHLWLPTGESTLDVIGDGLTLFSGPDAAVPDRLAGGPPVTHHRLDALSARALGLRPGDSLLVRPDGLPVASAQRSEELPLAA